MFETAQWAQSSEAAASLAQMAARGTRGDPELAALARERQDLVGQWQKRDGLRNTWLGQPADKRNDQAEAENNAKLVAIDTRIKEIDAAFREKFPDYAALANPAPLAVGELQALLGPDEALVFFLDTPKVQPTPEETFIWVATKTDVRWVRSDLGTEALTRGVQALRCGLDGSNWTDASKWPEGTDAEKQRKSDQQTRRARCKELLRREVSDSELLPFDVGRAHELYKALFGQIEDLIKDRQLIIVPSGPLTSLPFQVLVTEKPAAGENYRQAAWLETKQPIAILPSVSSLKALRRLPPPTADQAFIGFGNPLLEGNPGNANDRQRAKLASEWQRCSDIGEPPRIVASVEVPPATTRGPYWNAEQVRAQPPLPETARELCTVARALGVKESDLDHVVKLGNQATKTTIREMNDDHRALEHYRVVHFATHGVVAGQWRDLGEPGLILTPPKDLAQADKDDGYLSASDATELKLNADWVVLSACNTAAGENGNAETLSGLAKAFFYAGARALLVSHWPVKSNATVKLITTAVGELQKNDGLPPASKIGRAEALRRSMSRLIKDGTDFEAHPAYWAPFVLVGEGAAAR
jgi:CHAT domain-containing protein